jgi:hypothetical protein
MLVRELSGALAIAARLVLACVLLTWQQATSDAVGDRLLLSCRRTG